MDHDEFGRWRAEADSAMAAARRVRDGNQHNWTCFLAEQAAQLAVKALLHGLGTGPWGHDVIRLGRELAAATGEPLPLTIENALARLAKLYIPTRYPDAHPEGSPADRFTADEADGALSDAELILATVDDLWRQLEAG